MKKWSSIISILIFVFLLGYYARGEINTSGVDQTEEVLEKEDSLDKPKEVLGDVTTAGREKAVVKRVIDGDTIELTDGRKLRYIGIDTPETVHPNKPVGCFGKQASDKNKELVLDKEIQMEKDVSNTDRYKRLLRYVYIIQDNEEIMINEFLVMKGYALASSYPPDIKHQEILQKAEQFARENNEGLWGSCNVEDGKVSESEENSVTQETTSTESGDCTIKGNISTKGDKIFHVSGCGSYEKTVIDETRGERMFCSEQEALDAGWRKAGNC